MRRILLSTLLLVIGGPARAEDFTGFYAGINAGYARGHEQGRTVNDSPVLPVKPGADLPPSARDAAQALQRPQFPRTASPSER
jgi:hypothetical protein